MGGACTDHRKEKGIEDTEDKESDQQTKWNVLKVQHYN